MYDPHHTKAFYDAYGTAEWDRLQATAYGRLKAIAHTDFIHSYLKPGDNVLDAGSGPGRFSIVMARLGGRVTVLDISQRQLDLAREKISEAELLDQVDQFVEADIGDLSMLSEGSFDFVVCYGGALSYVCERRAQAAAALVRVTKPGGVLLVSVMSRFGATANLVRRPHLEILEDPERHHLWSVVRDGDLPGFESTHVEMQHPAMHLYSSDELQDLFAGCRCDTLEVAGSNVTAVEGASALEDVAGDPKTWATAVEIERALCRTPGLVDGGSHIIFAARRSSEADAG